MDWANAFYDHTHRLAVDALNGEAIEKSSHWSPDVPDDLREWLPNLFDRFPIVWPWSKPQPIDPALHKIWIFDNTAFRTPSPSDNRPELAKLADPNATKPKRVDGQPTRGGSGWEVEFVACCFIKNSGRDLAGVNAALVHHLAVADDDVATKKRIASRLEPFIDSVLPNRTLRITIGDVEHQTLGPLSHSGISSQLLEMHFDPAREQLGQSVQSHAINLPPPFGLASTTIFAEEKGWGIISDIDDTIKVTRTIDPIGILKNTFVVETPEPIAGMPELYAHAKSVLSDPPFFYLSASPYNLYRFLRIFRDAHYPLGTIILRDASWQNLGGLITSLTQNTKEYKDDRIAKIHTWFPHRRYICFGDSMQSDPEAYGQAARRFPGWIRAIFIRKVVGIAGMDEKRKNANERFEWAFRGLDRKLWHVFSDPAEVTERIDELARDEHAMVGGESF
ncbi:hypothetical protein EJ03DRAFT_355415 [Teratosphaeria nubilosa]|uniref:Phosphatidate phosphatase APP1 catalytic domain-containing protein n=1 Tax=Teratosphaeria nubilosa TaxID=161662 RepID=A0A6G1KWS8_9PEZI|nr:hypothetical protein EJ03DRAFT_355415 [Teratosphaeria nubilosa]